MGGRSGDRVTGNPLSTEQGTGCGIGIHAPGRSWASHAKDVWRVYTAAGEAAAGSIHPPPMEMKPPGRYAAMKGRYDKISLVVVQVFFFALPDLI